MNKRKLQKRMRQDVVPSTSRLSITLQFTGSEIDRLVDFCDLLKNADLKGFHFKKGKFEGLTPVSLDYPLMIDFHKLPEVVKEKLYVRTIRIYLADEYIEIGGENAIQENIALHKFEMTFQFDDSLLSDLNLERAKRIIQVVSTSQKDILRLRIWILLGHLTNQEREKLASCIDGNIISCKSEERARFLVSLIEDLNDQQDLEAKAKNYKNLHVYFRTQFARCLKSIFKSLPAGEIKTPNSILEFYLDQKGKNEGGTLVPQEEMWICEAFWFLDGDPTDYLLANLFSIAESGFTSDVREAALCSLSRQIARKTPSQRTNVHYKLSDETKSLVRKIVRNKKLDALCLVAIYSLSNLYFVSKKRNKKTISLLLKSFSDTNYADRTLQKKCRVAALSFSKVTSKLDKGEEPKLLQSAFKMIGMMWMHSEDREVRRACAKALIGLLRKGFDPKILTERLNKNGQPDKGVKGTWTVREIHKESNFKKDGFEPSADLNSIIVASYCEQFDLADRLTAISCKMYEVVPDLKQLGLVVNLHAKAELIILAGEPLHAISLLGKCVEALNGHAPHFGVFEKSVIARQKLVEALSEDVPSNKLQDAIKQLKILENLLNQGGKDFVQVEKSFVTSLIKLVESVWGDAVSGLTLPMPKQWEMLREAEKLARESKSPGLRTLAGKMYKYRDSGTSVPDVDPSSVNIEWWEPFAEILIMKPLNKLASRISAKMLRWRLDKILNGMRVTFKTVAFRPIGLLSAVSQNTY